MLSNYQLTNNMISLSVGSTYITKNKQFSLLSFHLQFTCKWHDLNDVYEKIKIYIF